MSSQDHKKGYLVMRAVGGGQWKRRFFVLTDHSLVFYLDEKGYGKGKAKGNVVLTSDSKVAARDVGSIPNCFAVVAPDQTLYVSAQTVEEMKAWIKAIGEKIAFAANVKKGYMTKRAIISASNWQRRFFMLGMNSLSYCKDESTTKDIRGQVRLSRNTKVAAGGPPDDKNTPEYCFSVVTSKKTLFVGAESEEEMKDWMRAISECCSTLPEATTDEDECDYCGLLTKRAVVSGDNWKERWFVLKGSSLCYYKDENSTVRAKGEFTLTPDCTVYETNLRKKDGKTVSFELVTPNKVLHVQAESYEEKQTWMQKIKENISKSTVELHMDPVQAAARKRVALDDFYDVTFATKKPLGVTLEQHGEWAVVKLAQDRSTKIDVGSVLSAVNGESVMLKTYSETVSLIKGWEPPLVLRFRRPPIKKGWLEKMSRGVSAAAKLAKANWKGRHFVLSHGTLQYFANAKGELKGEFALVGSAVSLVPKEEAKREHCFKIVSGSGNLTMQAQNEADQMSWASALYHAITIANGGGYILEMEREWAAKREDELRLAEGLLTLRVMAAKKEAVRRHKEQLAEENERQKKLAEEEAARLEAERKAKEEEARKIAEAEAEAKAKAEAEAKAAAEEAERVAREAEEAERKRQEEEAAAAAEAARLEEEAAAEAALAEAAAEAAAVLEVAKAAKDEEEAKEAEVREAAEAEAAALSNQAAKRASMVRKPSEFVDLDDNVNVDVDAEAAAAAAAEAEKQKSMSVSNSMADMSIDQKMESLDLLDEEMGLEQLPDQEELLAEEESTALRDEMADADLEEDDDDDSDDDSGDDDDAAGGGLSMTFTLQAQKSDPNLGAIAAGDGGGGGRNFTPGKAQRRSVADNRRPKRVSMAPREDSLNDRQEEEPLTADELRKAFVAMDESEKGFLNPMSLGRAIRAITGKANLMHEMQIYNRYNLDGDAKLDVEEFVEEGQRETDPQLIRGFRQYAGTGQAPRMNNF